MNHKISCFLALLLLAPAAVLAAKADGPKARAMAKYDLNHDGKFSADEIAAIQKDFAAAPAGDLARFDTDKDGKLSAEEIAKMVPGSGKKSDKKMEQEPKAKNAAKETKASADEK